MGYKEEVKTKTVKYTWNKCGVCQAAHEQLRVKNGRGGSWKSTVFLSLSFSLYSMKQATASRIRKFRDLYLSHDLQNPPDETPPSAFELDPHSCFLTLRYFPSFSRACPGLLFPSLSHDYNLKSTEAPFALWMDQVYYTSETLTSRLKWWRIHGHDYIFDELNR